MLVSLSVSLAGLAFNSLFEIRRHDKSIANELRRINTFNSLFEILRDSVIISSVGSSTFNSLFEIRLNHLRRRQDLLRVFQFSF